VLRGGLPWRDADESIMALNRSARPWVISHWVEGWLGRVEVDFHY
jgi:hypothetical protein